MKIQISQTTWGKFASLTWYDSFIEFLFKFTAKTSEPLLALGLVVSAADLLTKGALMHNNPGLTFAWAWAQAIAIEASSGVVFVYALQSFKSQDKVKGWLYLILSVLLAVCGGAMLLLQLVFNLTGQGENNLPDYIVYGLAILRVVVSIGYVYMCRAKHIRFNDLSEDRTEQNPQEQNRTHEDAIKQLAEQVSVLVANMGQITATVSEVKTTVTQITATSLLALPMRTEQAEPLSLVESEPVRNPLEENKKTKVLRYLNANPDASISEIVSNTGVTKSYASTLRSQLNEE